MKTQVEQIVKALINSGKYAVIGSDEMTNIETIDFLCENYEKTDKLNVIENKDHLLIY